MTLDAIVKYVGAGLMLASLYYLVLAGSLAASEYVGLVTGIFAALGIYHSNKPAASAVDPAPAKPAA